MKIRDIHIDGFGVWTGLTVDALPETMTVFYGPNEAGKTTLMQFLRAVAYGVTPDRRERYLPPVYGGTPGGAIRVTGPGGGYEINRTASMTDGDGEGGRVRVTGDDGHAHGTHRLMSLLGGVDEAIFNNVFAIGIRELQELGSLDDTAAADELYKLSSGLDRVSLVDVLRGLRRQRRELVGRDDAEPDDEPETAGRLASLIRKRERLRHEVQSLSGHTRTYNDLAARRRTDADEIESLGRRIEGWQREMRTVEAATGVHDAWRHRDEVIAEIEAIEHDVHLPDDAPAQLVQIDAMIEERRGKVEEVKTRRREIRTSVASLPVSKAWVDLQGRIDAAGEQATWIEALEEQIARLDKQVDAARRSVDVEAERLGLDETDRESLAAGDWSKLPDLSRQTLATLSEPAKAVKESLFQLKQARTEGKRAAARQNDLLDQLSPVLERAGGKDVLLAVKRESERASRLRQRITLGEQLDRLRRHHRELERDAVELTTDEVMPLDRVVLLGVPFLASALSLAYGAAHMFAIDWLISRPDPFWGAFLGLLGFVFGLMYYIGRENGRRVTSMERDDCERQIDSLKRQIRETEAEVDGDADLSGQNTAAVQQRLHESERLIGELEAAMPTHHNLLAATEATTAAKKRAVAAVDKLRDAKRRWTSSLVELGLAESMSASKVRKLSDGYESLQAARRRVDDLVAERTNRQRERQTIAGRIETLYQEAIQIDADTEGVATPESAGPTSPLAQLKYLNERVARHHHWIEKRRKLKDQDGQLKKIQTGHARHIERGEQQRRALWAKCGVATQEQFHEMVDRKSQLLELRKNRDEADRQIRGMIGHAAYDDVAREIGDATSSDLERRWESLSTQITDTQTRIDELRTAQGELTSRMKHLADDGRLMTVKLELGMVERRIASVVRQWQTSATVTTLLDEVCRTVERDRQPETLREASSFLSRLTDGKYVRVWTPLGHNRLRIEDADGKSLPLEVLSRGTREAVFIALRLSLASSYARRGVMLPLVLDDVLVNFDGDRARHAAETLKMFAELGHQVMMFTCHRHIVDIFHDIDVQVRQMPPQGVPGRAEILEPEYEYEEVEEVEEIEEPEAVVEIIEEVVEEPIAEVVPPEPEPEAIPEPEPVVVEPSVAPPPVAEVRPIRPKPKPRPKTYDEYVEEWTPAEVQTAEVQTAEEPSVDHAWYEREDEHRFDHWTAENEPVHADADIDGDEALAAATPSWWGN